AESGSYWTNLEGTLQPAEEPFVSVGKLFARVNFEEPDESVERFLARFEDDASMQPAVFAARIFAEGFDAVHVGQASVQAIAHELTGSAGLESPQYRPSAGYDRLLETFIGGLPRERFRLHLQTTVESVKWKAGSVRISARRFGDSCSYDADCAIVTVPVSILQAGSIRFVPELPSRTRAALQSIAMGPVLKVVMQFSHPFWMARDTRMSDAAFFFNKSTKFATFWTMYPRISPVVVAWAAGGRTDRFSGMQPQAIVQDAISDLALTLEMSNAELNDCLVSAHLHDWQRDPFSLGAYSYLRVGGNTAREELAQPLERTVYFAGEATATDGRGGTVAGALISGYTAAKALLDGRG
ncbi:MAG TPA: NAD(P)/FAD-dependent oxidoreductase, partial [Candidatus Baltobacteraceae bacterium]|nr:NAD(P)/FAD-dependent oxidoreductase [Candidatus Baltobacteraceae bacterium]